MDYLIGSELVENPGAANCDPVALDWEFRVCSKCRFFSSARIYPSFRIPISSSFKNRFLVSKFSRNFSHFSFVDLSPNLPTNCSIFFNSARDSQSILLMASILHKPLSNYSDWNDLLNIRSRCWWRNYLQKMFS